MLWASLAPRAAMTAATLLITSAPAAVGGDFSDVLLSLDFVYEGTIRGEPYGPQTPHGIPVTVTKVHLGSMPSSTIVVDTWSPVPWPPNSLRPGARVLGWGSWDNVRSDTCFGNVLVIQADGAFINRYPLTPEDPARTMSIDGQPIDKPGQYAKLIRSIETRATDNGIEWLATGEALIEVEVMSVNRSNKSFLVRTQRVVSGAASPPVFMTVRWQRPSSCYFEALAGQKFILPISKAQGAELKVTSCLLPLLINKDSTIRGLGVSPKNLSAGLRAKPGGAFSVRRTRD